MPTVTAKDYEQSWVEAEAELFKVKRELAQVKRAHEECHTALERGTANHTRDLNALNSDLKDCRALLVCERDWRAKLQLAIANVTLECSVLHHHPDEYHRIGEECPAEKRVAALLKQC